MLPAAAQRLGMVVRGAQSHLRPYGFYFLLDSVSRPIISGGTSVGSVPRAAEATLGALGSMLSSMPSICQRQRRAVEVQVGHLGGEVPLDDLLRLGGVLLALVLAVPATATAACCCCHGQWDCRR